MALWSAFFPDLLPATPGCPDPLLEKETRTAAIEFLRRTRAWVEWLDPATTLDGLVTYDFELPTGADVSRVERATLDGNGIEILSYRDAPHDWTLKELTDQGVITRDRKTFSLGTPVAAGRTIQVQVALIPSRASTGLPDDLFERYSNEIAAGALARLLLTSNTAFYKPDLAAVKKAEFDSAIASFAVDAWRGHAAHTPRARPKFC